MFSFPHPCVTLKTKKLRSYECQMYDVGQHMVSALNFRSCVTDCHSQLDSVNIPIPATLMTLNSLFQSSVESVI